MKWGVKKHIFFLSICKLHEQKACFNWFWVLHVFIACSCLLVQSRPDLRLLLHPSSSAQGWMNAFNYPRCFPSLPSHTFLTSRLSFNPPPPFFSPDILFVLSLNQIEINKYHLLVCNLSPPLTLVRICVSLFLSSIKTTHWLIAKGQK